MRFATSSSVVTLIVLSVALGCDFIQAAGCSIVRILIKCLRNGAVSARGCEGGLEIVHVHAVMCLLASTLMAFGCGFGAVSPLFFGSVVSGVLEFWIGGLVVVVGFAVRLCIR